jgi:vacuolar-type H+-ATPase subunit F/Vma7
MSRLLVITRPTLLPGFELARVDALGAEDVETAEEFIEELLESGKTGLLAIDDGIFARIDPALIRRLDATEHLPYLTIPGGQPLGPEATRKYRLAEMIRRAIGFHVIFKGEEAGGGTD